MPSRTQKWVTALIEGLNAHVDEKTCALILEGCGRQCQTQSLIKKAREIYAKSTSMEDFVGKLSKVYKHLHKQGDRLYLIYPRCYCTQVNKIPKGKISATYCNCSRGWAKALFEGAIGKPVQVHMEKTIIKGDDECRFRIML